MPYCTETERLKPLNPADILCNYALGCLKFALGRLRRGVYSAVNVNGGAFCVQVLKMGNQLTDFEKQRQLQIAFNRARLPQINQSSGVAELERLPEQPAKPRAPRIKLVVPPSDRATRQQPRYGRLH